MSSTNPSAPLFIEILRHKAADLRNWQVLRCYVTQVEQLIGTGEKRARERAAREEQEAANRAAAEREAAAAAAASEEEEEERERQRARPSLAQVFAGTFASEMAKNNAQPGSMPLWHRGAGRP
ncbi:hypothetical protein [Variovorax sp. J22R115]|uniref:hypothetical protein n=1 Tax=Variovorax sp. J22R115 TaxID=3053509 RepID=UPI002575CE28|nr:hypothetical protein [Variovorax sp. J22R115]MDM0053916.1 hypothetical protein [Variovorax sp. J22R115]